MNEPARAARASLASRLRRTLLPRQTDDLDSFDPGFAQAVAPPVKTLLGAYFRASVEGIENIPAGPVMIIGNHNAGLTFLEPFIFAAEYYLQRGYGEPLRFLGHDAIARMPGLAPLLARAGVVRAAPGHAAAVLAAGQKLVVFPGGNREAFRPFRDRHRIDFGGHKGFAALALETGAPIVPLLSVGGHETFVVLTRGERLAKLLRADKLLRSPSWPVSLALPWGVAVGPVFHLPVPARFTIRVGRPIHPGEAVREHPPEQRVDALYDRVVSTLQSMMDEVTRFR